MLRRNIAANFVGQAWSAVLGIALVPVYVRYLGPEAYGLVGFFLSLQAILVVLDMGLSATANREVAILARNSDLGLEIHRLVRTLEVVYLGVGLGIAIAFVLGSAWIASYGTNPKDLPISTVRLAVVIFGATVGLRWPVSLYAGALRGLEKQVLLNGVSVSLATLKHAGGALLLVFYSSTVLTFLAWQLATALLELLVMFTVTWKVVPHSKSPGAAFDKRVLRRVWLFSLRLGAISAFAAVLKQLDKVIISRLLTLDQVGYYTIASTASAGLSLLVGPVFVAAYPRFTALISEQSKRSLADVYHKTAAFVSFVTVPVACAVGLFSYDVLLVWTRSDLVASSAHVVLTTLALAGMLNSMMQLPYALQLASGLTWIPLYNNALSVLLLSPLTFILVSKYGIKGAGVSWVIFNLFYYAIVPQVMHRYILSAEKAKWILEDTLPFMATGLVVFGGMRAISIWIGGSTGWAFALITLGFLIYAILASSFYRPARQVLTTCLLIGHLKDRLIGGSTD